VDWRPLAGLSLGLFLISLLGLTGALSLPEVMVIALNGSAFALAYLYVGLELRGRKKPHLQDAQPIAGNVVGDLVGSALVAYGLKGGEGQ
jgi:hypothetical protein